MPVILNINNIIDLVKSPCSIIKLEQTKELKITLSKIEEDNNLPEFMDTFALLGDVLSKNSNLESIHLEIVGGDTEFDEIIHACFFALASIRKPIKIFYASISSDAFDFEHLLPNPIIGIISQASVFHHLEKLTLICDANDSKSTVLWADFFVGIFEAVQNKSELNDLTLDLYSLDLVENNNASERAINAIRECTTLNIFNITGNWIPDAAWNFLGNFIKGHHQLNQASVNAQLYSENWGFLIPIFQSTHLKSLKLVFKGYWIVINENYIQTLRLINYYIQRFVGLSKLDLDFDMQLPKNKPMLKLLAAELNSPMLRVLDMEYPHDNDIPYVNIIESLSKLVKSRLLVSVLKNPTLSHLNINFNDGIEGHMEDDLVIHSILDNKMLTTVEHKYKANSLISKILKIKTEENLSAQKQMIPFFRASVASAAHFELSPKQLIKAHTIWLSLMSNYALTASDDRYLTALNNLFFHLSLIQFLSQTGACPSVSPDVISSCIEQYLSMADFANMSRATGGYFFRERKPLVIQPALPAPVGFVS